MVLYLYVIAADSHYVVGDENAPVLCISATASDFLVFLPPSNRKDYSNPVLSHKMFELPVI